jgi:hypothetical protein
MTNNRQIIARSAAKSANIARFYTGVACSRGHLSPRYTASGNCCECARAASSANYVKRKRQEYGAPYQHTVTVPTRAVADEIDALAARRMVEHRASVPDDPYRAARALLQVPGVSLDVIRQMGYELPPEVLPL